MDINYWGTGNPCIDIVIRTSFGHARDVLIVQPADAVIAIGGGHGTLSKIAVPLKMKRPVFGLKTWEIKGVVPCATPDEAVLMAIRAARRSPSYHNRRAVQGFP